MATIDELGRQAGRNLLDEATTLVDVEEGLEQITSSTGAVSAPDEVGERGSRRPSRLWAAVAAAAVIAVVTGVVVVTRRSGPERLVTDAPTESTDGDARESPVRLVPSLGDVVTIDIDDPTHVRAAVSPNGAWVAYRGAGGSVCLASLTGTTDGWCEEIPEFGRLLSWSPDSTRFTGSEELQSGRLTRPSVVNLDGTWTTLDLSPDTPLIQTSFALDGDSIVGSTPGTSDTGSWRLVLVDADTGATRVVADVPSRLGTFPDPFPIDPARSVVYGRATTDDPDAEPAFYVLDHNEGTLEPIHVPDGDTLTRVPIGVTSTQPPVVLMAKARPIRELAGGTEVAFHDFELWDIGTGEVTPLPSSPSGVTPFGSAISPDGEHVAMAWTTDDGVLQLGVARIDDFVTADGGWPDDAWSSETLADVDLSSGYYTELFEPQRVCWCHDQVVVIARDNVYTLDIAAIPDIQNTGTTRLPD
jgi:hypothetical protein